MRNLKYENMWRRDPSYLRLVEETWGDANTNQDMNQLKTILGQMQLSFQDWEHSFWLSHIGSSEFAPGTGGRAEVIPLYGTIKARETTYVQNSRVTS